MTSSHPSAHPVRTWRQLDVTNFHAGTGPLNLGQLEVFAKGASKPLASFSGTALARLLDPGKALDADTRRGPW